MPVVTPTYAAIRNGTTAVIKIASANINNGTVLPPGIAGPISSGDWEWWKWLQLAAGVAVVGGGVHHKKVVWNTVVAGYNTVTGRGVDGPHQRIRDPENGQEMQEVRGEQAVGGLTFHVRIGYENYGAGAQGHGAAAEQEHGGPAGELKLMLKLPTELDADDDDDDNDNDVDTDDGDDKAWEAGVEIGGESNDNATDGEENFDDVSI